MGDTVIQRVFWGTTEITTVKYGGTVYFGNINAALCSLKGTGNTASFITTFTLEITFKGVSVEYELVYDSIRVVGSPVSVGSGIQSSGTKTLVDKHNASETRLYTFYACLENDTNYAQYNINATYNFTAEIAYDTTVHNLIWRS